MPYRQLFYYMVWATQARKLTLTAENEQIVYGLVCKRAVGLGGKVFALNGMTDHVHFDDDMFAEFLTPDECTFSGPLPGGATL